MTMETWARATPEVLFRQHYARLVRGLAVGCGSEEDAADAVQEAFVELFVRWDRVGTYQDPVGWVRRVAINRLLKRRRSLERRRRALERIGPDEAHLDGDAATRIDLARSLAGLPLKQQVAVGLHYVAGLSVAETARAMGVAKGTVDSHLHRARQTLRPMLEVDR